MIKGDLLGAGVGYGEVVSGEPGLGEPGSKHPECPHLVADEELALPQGAGHIMDGQAQVVVAVLEVQDAGLLDQLSSQLFLQLYHLLQCPGCQPSSRGRPLYCPPPRARGGQPSGPACVWQVP